MSYSRYSHCSASVLLPVARQVVQWADSNHLTVAAATSLLLSHAIDVTGLYGLCVRAASQDPKYLKRWRIEHIEWTAIQYGMRTSTRKLFVLRAREAGFSAGWYAGCLLAEMLGPEDDAMSARHHLVVTMSQRVREHGPCTEVSGRKRVA